MTFPCLAQVLKGHFGVVAPDVEVEDGKGKVSVGGGEAGHKNDLGTCHVRHYPAIK